MQGSLEETQLGLHTILYMAYGHVLMGERWYKNCHHPYHKKCLGGADSMVQAKIQLFMVWYGMSFKESILLDLQSHNKQEY
jgi:hypothetical protein